MQNIPEYVVQFNKLKSTILPIFPNVIGIMVSEYTGVKYQDSIQELLDLTHDELNEFVKKFDENFGGAVPLEDIYNNFIECVNPYDLFEYCQVCPNWKVSSLRKLQSLILDCKTDIDKINNIYRSSLYFFDESFQKDFDSTN